MLFFYLIGDDRNQGNPLHHSHPSHPLVLVFFCGKNSEGSHSSGSGAQQTLPVVWLHPTGTSDSAKGVSLVVVVDPFKREGLWSLEQVGERLTGLMVRRERDGKKTHK